MSSQPPFKIDPAIRDEAARWIVRRDRGLSSAEAAEFMHWLQADPRHAEAVARSIRVWGLLGQAAAAPAADARKSVHWRRWVAFGGLAIAAAVALAYFGRRPVPKPELSHPVIAQTIGPRSMQLSDGTTVLLNVDSEVVEQFVPEERRVLLVRGEAHFSVTKNPDRPFIVQAGPVKVRAVGTAFDVNIQHASIDVLVTEGKVRVASAVAQNPDAVSTTPAEPPLVIAGQRAVATLAPAPGQPDIVVSEVTQDEQARTLTWLNPWLRLGGTTLADLAAEFQRRTGHRLVLADAQLAEMHVGGRFRADDVEGFVRLLVDNYGVVAERVSEKETVLRRK